MEIEIRRAIPGDAGAIAELATALGYPSSRIVVSKRLADTLSRNDHFVAVAVDASCRVIGWIHACEELRIESDRKVEVGGLIVKKQERGKGAGLKLLEAAESWAAELGVADIRLRSNVVRENAHAFFERAGYRNTKTSRVFDKTLSVPGDRSRITSEAAKHMKRSNSALT